MDADINARLDRLESTEEIRQLVAKYCLALDMRDLDALVSLFPEDVRVSREHRGRKALRAWFDETLRVQFNGTAHVTGNHIIEFDDADQAHGVVYSRNEHETGPEWVIMTMMYWDRYERIDGRWFFRRRLPLYWYATDLNKPPIGERKMRWPGREPYEGGFSDFWPTWKEFWATPPDLEADVAEPAALDGFLTAMRRGAPETLNVRVR
jgi:ketosteroid isomerase-like protein